MNHGFAIQQAVIAQDAAVVPEFADEGGGFGHTLKPGLQRLLPLHEGICGDGDKLMCGSATQVFDQIVNSSGVKHG